MSRWGDRDRKRSKKQKVKVFNYTTKDKQTSKESNRERRENQFYRELERVSQDVEEPINNEDISENRMFMERAY